ncbi:unnamed protein product [Ixodes persulcatus]
MSLERQFLPATSGRSLPRRWQIYQPVSAPQSPPLPLINHHVLRERSGYLSKAPLTKGLQGGMFEPICCSRRRSLCDSDLPLSQDSDSPIEYGPKVMYGCGHNYEPRHDNKRQQDHMYIPVYDSRPNYSTRYDEPKSGYRPQDDYKQRVGYEHRDDYCQRSEEEPRQPQMQNTRAEYQPCSARDGRSEHRVPRTQKSANRIYTEQVARNAWANYEKEFKRYQAALAEWDYQQELVRKKLGMTRSGRGSATQETVKASRPPDSIHSLEPKMAPKPADQPTTIRIGLSGNKIHKIEPQKSSTEGLRPQFTRMSLNDYGQR